MLYVGVVQRYSVYVWGKIFFKFVGRRVRKYVSMDNAKMQQERLDVDKLLIRAKDWSLVNTVITVKINDELFPIQILEEIHSLLDVENDYMTVEDVTSKIDKLVTIVDCVLDLANQTNGGGEEQLVHLILIGLESYNGGAAESLRMDLDLVAHVGWNPIVIFSHEACGFVASGRVRLGSVCPGPHVSPCLDDGQHGSIVDQLGCEEHGSLVLTELSTKGLHGMLGPFSMGQKFQKEPLQNESVGHGKMKEFVYLEGHCEVVLIVKDTLRVFEGKDDLVEVPVGSMGCCLRVK
ncbi:hypothetical protein VNO78_31531 [Psophocarpus tetragonolobus]|uniref:Uncharacterized protein n=1 Tax=Psophocarpus tetragonolobus TaxID=3891 RepID=A0AAN9RYM7_PSOTE